MVKFTPITKLAIRLMPLKALIANCHDQSQEKLQGIVESHKHDIKEVLFNLKIRW